MADALVVPGRNLGPYSPLPWYAGEVAARRGAQVRRHEWTGEPPGPLGPQLIGWVRDQIAPLAGGRPLLVGKSLGSLAAGLAAERSLPAVWLTPLLTVPWAVELLERATAPYLLVGGTGDDLWDGAVARRLTPHVLEVEDADHGMVVPGSVPDSIAVLARVATAVDDFLTTIAWP